MRRPGPLRVLYFVVMLGAIAFALYKLHQMLGPYGF